MPNLKRHDAYAPLLESLGVQDLPIATPLDLAQLPIVRPTNQIDERQRDADGNLPREVWEVRTLLDDPSGVEREVIVRGSPKEGLPYGRDGDVLLALAILIAEHRYYDGIIEEASLSRIARAIGKDLDGPEAKRILSALSRLAGVQVETTMPLVEPEEAARVLQGDEAPHPPPRTRSRKTRRAKISLLNLVWDTETLSTGDGETLERVRIQHLALEPLLVHYAISGGVAWIDREAFMAIGDTPIARALYLHAASEVARGRVGTWEYELRVLRDRLGMSASTRPARAREYLENAAALLQEQRVLSSFQIEKAAGRGRYRVSMTPGPLLGIARLLRGVGLHELADARKQIVLLGSIGIHSTRARQLMRQSSHDVYLHLAYLKYMEETQPDQIRDPAAWLIDSFRKGVPLDTNDVFVTWLEEQTARPSKETELSLPLNAPPAAPLPKPLPPEPPAMEVLPPRDPAAAQLWQALSPEIAERYPSKMTQTALRGLAPFAIEGETLVLRTRNSFTRDWVRGTILDDLVLVAANASAGQVGQVRVDLVEDEGESLDSSGGSAP